MLRVKLFFVLFVTLALYACSTNDSVKLGKVKSCNFPETNEKAPLWVCGASVDGLVAQGVGVAKKSKAGISFTKQKSSANARVVLAQALRADISSKLSENINSKNGGDEEVVNEVTSFVSEQVTSASLVGAKVYAEAYSKDGTLYTLVGLKKDDYNLTLKSIEQNAKDSEILSQQAKQVFVE